MSSSLRARRAARRCGAGGWCRRMDLCARQHAAERVTGGAGRAPPPLLAQCVTGVALAPPLPMRS